MSNPDLLARYGPWALVAGGSEGTGAAFAERLAKAGFDLVLIARKPAPLEALADDLRTRFGRTVRTAAVDLAAPDAAERVASAADGLEIGLLIYNAGAESRFARFLDRPLDENERMLRLNATTPMQLAHGLGGAMAARGKGGIVLLSSVAGSAGGPGMVMYSASKAFGNVLAEGLWYELGERGVHVLGLVLGLTRTPAAERMGLRMDGAFVPAEPRAVVDEALAHLADGPTYYASGTAEAATALRTLPRADAVRALAGSAASLE